MASLFRSDCGADAWRLLAVLVLPAHTYEARAARWHRVLVVRSLLPGQGSFARNLDELELYGCSCWERDIKEPIRIVRVEHGAGSGIERRTPVPELDRAASQEDIVSRVRRNGVRHGEGNWYEGCREHRERNSIRRSARMVLELDLIDTVAYGGQRETDGRI